MNANELKALDLAHIWHPCTQMKDHENVPLIPIKKAMVCIFMILIMQNIWIVSARGG